MSEKTYPSPRAPRAADVLVVLGGRLPPPLRRWVPPEMVGFAVLGGLTFGVDLSLLWGLHTWTPLPLGVAVSVAYVSAVALNYVLNRVLNFRSRAPVGGEAFRYMLMAVTDYLVTVGVTTGLAHLGVDFRVARLVAAGVVAIFLYVTARWFVFRQR